MVTTINGEDDAGPPTAAGASDEVRKVVAVMNGANALLKRQTAQSELFNQEFDKRDMNDALTPAGLTSYAAIIASRAELVRFDKLIGQRNELIHAALSAGQTYLRNADRRGNHGAETAARPCATPGALADLRRTAFSGAEQHTIPAARR